MRRTYHGFIPVILVAFMAVPSFAGNGMNGNGAPSGSHYNLNILGKDNCPGDDLKGSNRHTIFVLLNYRDGTPRNWTPTTQLDKRNKIFLTEGEDFAVLDGNACDGDGATFRLPANPFTCPSNDPECLTNDPTFQEYQVFVRGLGKPGGHADITTCMQQDNPDTLEYDPEFICSMETVQVWRRGKKSSFERVTKELTTVLADVDEDGNLERVGLFEDPFFGFFWDYDNYGLRLAQLRFYPITD
jgi:hypothetical protein